jgi:outer membrane protein OmpA-like peptidoglycan-associated protein
LKNIRFISMGTFLLVFLGCFTSQQVSQDNYLLDQGLREISKGNYLQAEANLLVALDLNPNNPYALLYLGDVYRNTNRIEKARQMYQRVVNLNPNESAVGDDRKGFEKKSLVDTAKADLQSLKASVNEISISKDSDLDGVYDDEDKCPGTPEGATVNSIGCWVLKGLLFDQGKWNINPQAYSALDEVISILEKNPHLKLEIQGHTDNLGPAKHNQRLSELRAKMIRGYLVKKGIDEKRLTWVGYGFSKPIASNVTPEGRARNRRVELKTIRK